MRSNLEEGFKGLLRALQQPFAVRPFIAQADGSSISSKAAEQVLARCVGCRNTLNRALQSDDSFRRGTQTQSAVPARAIACLLPAS